MHMRIHALVGCMRVSSELRYQAGSDTALFHAHMFVCEAHSHLVRRQRRGDAEGRVWPQYHFLLRAEETQPTNVTAVQDFQLE